jgi:hypothetical protein
MVGAAQVVREAVERKADVRLVERDRHREVVHLLELDLIHSL